jgi:BolA family transcriptional regulator, general stress-responsive regulator
MTLASEAALSAEIRRRLAALDPEVLELYDESGEHVGHAGAQAGGGHYRLLIVSRRFEGQPALARHRLVYQAVGDLMPRQIHALAITAYTPEELEAAFPAQ